MIRRRLVQPHPQEPPQRQRVTRPPSDPPLRIDPLEIPDQQQPEVHPGRQARPPPPRRIKPPAPPFHKLVEAALLEQLVQALIKRMTRSLRQRSLRHPHLFLPFLIFPSSHRHAPILYPFKGIAILMLASLCLVEEDNAMPLPRPPPLPLPIFTTGC